VREVPVEGTGELLGRIQRLLVAQPFAPTLAGALESVRQHGWDQRALGFSARALGEALARPRLRAAVGDVIDEVLRRYRERAGFYPRVALGLADLLGLIDRERIVAALGAGLIKVAQDPEHPLRARASEALDDFIGRLRGDPALVARVEAVKEEVVGNPVVGRVVEDAARAVRRALLADIAQPTSETVGWVVDRLERWRRALLADAALRREIDAWVKRHALEVLDRYHGAIAVFIEKGVHALGPEGAVRLIEEHAGDDLQYIRVNGTVVGGLAGGLLYAIHLLVRMF
jgi:uncharacterized membrane-anchored protein YjiN (DUF445 family)